MCVSATVFADTAALRSKPAMLRMSYEVLDIGAGENMGLAGAHYLINVDSDWYLGASGFGALRGERGGFFTGGFTLGTGKRFASKWLVDAGLFVGGGGGGAAPQGGGMMLRPHLSISRDVGDVMLGAGISRVKFPNGGIDSTQLMLTLGIPFKTYYTQAGDTERTIDSGKHSGLRLRESEWLATLGEYRPVANVRTRAGTPMTSSLKRVGFEYRRYADERRYFFVETAGAMGGQSDGYAELLAGAGYRVPVLIPQIKASASVALGGGGGGSVDTGGGGIAKLRVGLDYDLAPYLKLGLEAGRLASAGDFSANFYGLSVGYRIGEIGSGEGGRELRSGDAVHLAKWRLAGVQQTYVDAARKTGSKRNLNLVGLKLERFMTDSLYLTGQAYGAHSGDAGGYAVGLMGLGWEMPLRSDGRLSLSAEVSAGAAGGGGVDVGGGAILQSQLGLAWHFADQLALRLEAGKVKSREGNLDSNLFGVGLMYEFNRPEYRY